MADEAAEGADEGPIDFETRSADRIRAEHARLGRHVRRGRNRRKRKVPGDSCKTAFVEGREFRRRPAAKSSRPAPRLRNHTPDDRLSPSLVEWGECRGARKH